jgi:hypothetical protein
MKKRNAPYFRKATRGVPGGPKADLVAPDVPDVRRFGGINRAHIFPPPGRGVTVQIDAFSLYEGDQVSVYWASAGAPAASANVPPGQNGPLDILVAADKLQPYPGNIEVWHTIYRPASQETLISERLPVLVDFEVPGDPDPDQSTPYINENLAPIKGLDAGIPPGQPLTISVPRWKYCSFGDKLIVSWGPVDLPPVVITDTLGDAGPDVPVTVPWSIIESVNGGLAYVTYHIEDSVTNHSLWAKSVEVDASTGGHLPTPTVLDTDDFGKLPIEVLNFGPVRVQVQYPAYTSGDVVILTFGGINRDGIALPDTPYTYTWPTPAPIRHTFEVPFDKALALVGGEIRASYTVQALGAPKPIPSAIVVVEVTGAAANLPVPVVPEAGANNELDPAAPGLYVTVLVRTDYPFFQPTDRITLYWRGESLDGQTIVTDQQTQSGSDAVAGELRFAIARAKIVQVAGGKVTASYEVLTPGNVTVPSDKLALTVKTGSGSIGLPPAIVEGASADDTLDPGDVGETIVVHVPANASFLPGDTIQVIWQGVGVGGSFTTPAQVANTAGMRFEVNTSVLPPNAGQRVTVYYILIRPGADDQDSDKRYITVLEDSGEGDLPAPTVTQAANGQLDPVAAANGATVVVPARADLETSDTVTATFGSYTTSPPQAAQPGMTLLIPPAEIARHLGTSISVFYTRRRAGTPLDSDVLPLQVLDFQPQDPRVTPPVFTEANGTFVLDLNTFAADATVSVLAWPLMATGQRFWLRVIGGGTNWLIADGDAVSAVGAFTRTLARTRLDTLADNTTLTLQLAIAFDGGSEGTAKVFSSKPYTVRAKVTQPSFPPPEVPQAVGGTLPGNAPFATLRVPASAGLQAGDNVTGYFAGNPLGPKPATPGIALDFNVLAAYIAANQGKAVTVQYSVLRNGTTWTSDNLTLQVTTPPSEWDLEYDFDLDRVRYIGPGATISFPESRGVMSFQFDLDSNPLPDERIGVETFPFTPGGEFFGNSLYIGYPSGITNKNTVFVDFDQTWDVVRFAVTSASREVSISFKDAGLNVIGEIHFIGVGAAERQTLIVHDDQGGGRIRHAEIRSLEIIRLDSFKFRK